MSTLVSVPSFDEQAELTHCEAVIADGLGTFIEVGSALLRIRDARLYRADYATFADYCRQRWNIGRSRAYQLMDAAQVARDLSTIVDIGNEAQARAFASVPVSDVHLVADVVKKVAPGGVVTAALINSVADVVKQVARTGALDDGSGQDIQVSEIFQAAVVEETYERMMRQQEHIRQKSAPPAALLSSASNEWYTPKKFVEAARQLMGGIDLDPASCTAANHVVCAQHFYTIDDDGLSQPWTGRVWLNPPYGRGDAGESNQSRWTQKLIAEYESGGVAEAVLLVTASPASLWFQPLFAYPICFASPRIAFYTEAGVGNQPAHGHAFVYFGQQAAAFTERFSEFGAVVTAAVPKRAAL